MPLEALHVVAKKEETAIFKQLRAKKVTPFHKKSLVISAILTPGLSLTLVGASRGGLKNGLKN